MIIFLNLKCHTIPIFPVNVKIFELILKFVENSIFRLKL